MLLNVLVHNDYLHYEELVHGVSVQMYNIHFNSF